jgi:peptide/nickel transport system permease protein
LTDGAVNYRHALKNTLVPVITIIGLQFGNIFAFSIVVETVFQWPGLGLLVIQSIQFADVPLLAAYLVMIALGFAVLNLGIDLLYAAIDPRVRAGMISARARA